MQLLIGKIFKKIMKLTLTIFLSFFITSYFLIAQGEYNNWVFGTGAWVNFNSGTPILDAEASITTNGNATSISDTDGNLLFYTNGETVWNKNHIIMTNGDDIGGHDGIMSATIVPMPGNSSKYYIFSSNTTSSSPAYGLNYSIVDMSLDGGLGDVELTTKATVLLGELLGYGISASYRKDEESVWLIVHDLEDRFYEFLITSTGIEGPTVFQIGSVYNQANDKTNTIKVSPTRKQLMSVTRGTDVPPEVFCFDNQSGEISNPVQILIDDNENSGIEFSPDGNFIYTNTWDGGHSEVLQINANTFNVINVGELNSLASQLQIAPDNKIYIGLNFRKFLSTIENPNLEGLACHLIDTSFSINPYYSKKGLPGKVVKQNLSQYEYLLSSSEDSICINSFANVTISGGSMSLLDSIRWYWGDGNTSVGLVYNANHLYSTSGTFDVQAIIYSDCFLDTLQESIEVMEPEIEIIGDTLICSALESTALSAVGSSGNIQWSNGSITNTIEVGLGTYDVTVTTNLGCEGTDDVVVNTHDLTMLEIVGDTLYCEGGSTMLSASSTYNQYVWSTGSIGPQVDVMEGDYSLTVSDANGCEQIDSVQIVELEIPPLVILGNGILCASQTTGLKVSTGFSAYSWNTGETSDSIEVNASGTYSVTATTAEGCTRDLSINVIEQAHLDITFKGDTVLCLQDVGSRTLGVEEMYHLYHWSTNEDNQEIQIAEEGTYSVTVSDDNGCEQERSIFIKKETCETPPPCNFFVPKAVTPNLDELNDVFTPIIEQECEVHDYSFQVIDRWGNIVFNSVDLHEGWDGTYHNKLVMEGVYTWSLTYRSTSTNNKVVREYGTVTLLR